MQCLKITTIYHAQDLYKLVLQTVAFNMPARPVKFTRYCRQIILVVLYSYLHLAMLIFEDMIKNMQ